MVYFSTASLCSLLIILGTVTAAPAERSALHARAIGQIGSDNWSGALVSSPGGKTYKSVSATVIVPKAIFPQGFSSENYYTASVWVGFSGYPYLIPGQPHASTATGLLQVGFDYLFDKEGDAGIFPFYEFYPDPPIFFDDLKIDVKTAYGDKVRMTVTPSSATAGAIVFENLTTGKSSTRSVSAPAGKVLDLSIVEWITEDFTAAGLAKTDVSVDWGTLTFSDMTAIFSDGSVDDLTNAFKLESDHGSTGGRFAACDVAPQSKSTTCKWLGPNGKKG